jgi:signal transduction histidine kinase
MGNSRTGPTWLRVVWDAADTAWSIPAKGWRPSVRGACEAAVLTVVMVWAEYAEAHPTRVSDQTGFNNGHPPDMPAAALLLVAVAGLVLAWRASYPRLVVCCSLAAVSVFALLGYVSGAALLLPAVAIGTLSRLLPLSRAIAWAVGATAVTMVTVAVNNPLGHFGGGYYLIPANYTVALLAGIALANRRAYVDSVRAQAASNAAQEAQRRVEEERLRIARELHDVVAHTMATITVQAAAATQLLRDRPDEAAEALKAIRAGSKDGLRELRAILNLLRSDDGGDTGGADDPTQPVPGLNRLDALVAGVRAAGLQVTVTITGRQRALPAVTDLSAFRIIQEALTNALRHAGPATATVRLDFGQGELRVEVTDDGYGLTDSAAEAAYAAYLIGTGNPTNAPFTFNDDHDLSGGPGAAGGHGLRGMRERAAAAGGTIEIGPLPTVGFRVLAILPFTAAPADRAETAEAETAEPAEAEADH